MSDLRSFEEFMYGPDGKRENGAFKAIEAALADALAKKIQTVDIEVRKQPPRETSTQDGVWTFSASSDPEQAAASLLARLQMSPGDQFRGKVRLNFKEKGKSSNLLGSSFERTMAGSGGSIDEGSGTPAGYILLPTETIVNLLMRVSDQNIRLGDALVRTGNGVVQATDACTRLIQAHVPAQQLQPQANGQGELLLKTLGVLGAGIAGGPEAGAKAAAAAIAQAATAKAEPINMGGGAAQSSGAPPPPPPPPPGGAPDPAAWTEDQIEAWAKANPDAAKRMVTRAITGGAA